MTLEVHGVSGGGVVDKTTLLGDFPVPIIGASTIDGDFVLRLARSRFPDAGWAVGEFSGLLADGMPEIVVRLEPVRGAQANLKRLESGVVGEDGVMISALRVDLPVVGRIPPNCYLSIPLVRADGARAVLVNRGEAKS